MKTIDFRVRYIENCESQITNNQKYVISKLISDYGQNVLEVLENNTGEEFSSEIKKEINNIKTKLGDHFLGYLNALNRESTKEDIYTYKNNNENNDNIDKTNLDNEEEIVKEGNLEESNESWANKAQKDQKTFEEISDMNSELNNSKETIGYINPPLRGFYTFGISLPLPDGYSKFIPENENGITIPYFKDVEKETNETYVEVPLNSETSNIPIPYGMKIESCDDEDGYYSLPPSSENPLTYQNLDIVEGNAKYLIVENKEKIKYKPSLFEVKEEEQLYWKKVLPLPGDINKLCRENKENITGIIASFMSENFIYVCHDRLGAFIKENADELPLLMDELKLGHCHLLSWVECGYLRSFGIPAFVTNDLVTPKEGNAFKLAGHARVGVILESGDLQFHDPSEVCSSPSNYKSGELKDEVIEKLSNDYDNCESEIEKRNILRIFLKEIEKVTDLKTPLKETKKDKETNNKMEIIKNLNLKGELPTRVREISIPKTLEGIPLGEDCSKEEVVSFFKHLDDTIGERVLNLFSYKHLSVLSPGKDAKELKKQIDEKSINLFNEREMQDAITYLSGSGEYLTRAGMKSILRYTAKNRISINSALTLLGNYSIQINLLHNAFSKNEKDLGYFIKDFLYFFSTTKHFWEQERNSLQNLKSIDEIFPVKGKSDKNIIEQGYDIFDYDLVSNLDIFDYDLVSNLAIFENTQEINTDFKFSKNFIGKINKVDPLNFSDSFFEFFTGKKENKEKILKFKEVNLDDILKGNYNEDFSCEVPTNKNIRDLLEGFFFLQIIIKCFGDKKLKENIEEKFKLDKDFIKNLASSIQIVKGKQIRKVVNNPYFLKQKDEIDLDVFYKRFEVPSQERIKASKNINKILKEIDKNPRRSYSHPEEDDFKIEDYDPSYHTGDQIAWNLSAKTGKIIAKVQKEIVRVKKEPLHVYIDISYLREEGQYFFSSLELLIHKLKEEVKNGRNVFIGSSDTKYYLDLKSMKNINPRDLTKLFISKKSCIPNESENIELDNGNVGFYPNNKPPANFLYLSPSEGKAEAVKFQLKGKSNVIASTFKNAGIDVFCEISDDWVINGENI